MEEWECQKPSPVIATPDSYYCSDVVYCRWRLRRSCSWCTYNSVDDNSVNKMRCWMKRRSAESYVCPMSIWHTDISCGIMHAALSISRSRSVAERDDGRICCARWHRRRSVIGRSPSVRLRPPSRAVDRRSRVEKDRRTACRSIPLHFWTGKTRSGGGSDRASERASSNEARMLVDQVMRLVINGCLLDVYMGGARHEDSVELSHTID